MWDYTSKVKDHFENPRNIGQIDNPDGTGLVGSLACGDALRLMFKLDEKKEKIADAKFQTFGCASAIASSSALTEMIMGKTLEEAEKVTNKDIADFLGGLPDAKMHCSVMGQDALKAAIKNYRTGKENGEDTQLGHVCACFGVTRTEIENVAMENGLSTAEEVTNYTKAGGGCGKCVPQIEEILLELQGSQGHHHHHEEEVEKPPQKRLTNIQKIRLIEETIDREVRPMLQKDGGDIELIDVEGETVYVSLRGTCSGCKLANVTLNDVVAAKLREFVLPGIVVVDQTQSGA